jgi:Protein of unknown function (DUF2510)
MTGTGGQPAGWYADPSTRNDHRYWDGSAWTDQVSRGGVQGIDPLQPQPVQPVAASTPAPPTARPNPLPPSAVSPIATAPQGKKRPVYTRWWFIVGAVVVVLLIIAAAAGGGSDDTNDAATDDASTTTTTSTGAPAATPTAPPTAPPATVPAGPIFTQTGSGTATTASFKVPNSWDMAWTYDCANFGTSGNFVVSIYDLTGSAGGTEESGGSVDFDNQGVNQLGANGSGVEHFHSGGNTKYLKVISECNWTLTVTKA